MQFDKRLNKWNIEINYKTNQFHKKIIIHQHTPSTPVDLWRPREQSWRVREDKLDPNDPQGPLQTPTDKIRPKQGTVRDIKGP